MVKQFKYILQPRTYKIFERLLDDFYEYCTDSQLNPTIQRFEKYIRSRTLPTKANSNGESR